MPGLSADDVLREYRRKQKGPTDGVGTGRRLAAPSRGEAPGVAADMAWMEARLERLAAEAVEPAIPRHGRRACSTAAAAPPSAAGGSHPSSRRGSASAVQNLADLEAATEESTRRMRAEERRVALLRQQLGEAGVDLPLSKTPRGGGAAVSVCVRPAAVGGADELGDALLRRAALLRHQAPQLAHRIAELELERGELEQLLCEHPTAATTAPSAADSQAGADGRLAARAPALVMQLDRMNAALKQSESRPARPVEAAGQICGLEHDGMPRVCCLVSNRKHRACHLLPLRRMHRPLCFTSSRCLPQSSPTGSCCIADHSARLVHSKRTVLRNS